MEKKFKGAVFFDYDGTLTDKDEQVFYPSEKTVASIKALQKNGYAACLATGRSHKYLPQCGIDFDVLVTANGGCIIYDNEVISQTPFDKAILSEMTDYFNKHNMICVLENNKNCFVNLINDPLFIKMIGLYDVPHHLFTPMTEFKNDPIHKILLIYRDFSQLEHMKNALSPICDITVPTQTITSCDINPLNISKKNGVEEVCRIFGINKSDTYAFGDGENDLSMLRAVYHPVIMEKHHPCLDNIAEYITGKASENGIYKGLLHYGLIDKF